MDYSEGFLRTWRVFVSGMGGSIPGLTLFCHWRSARAAGDELGHPWQEYGERYLMRDDKNRRAYAGAPVLCMAVYSFLFWDGAVRIQTLRYDCRSVSYIQTSPSEVVNRQKTPYSCVRLP